MSEIGLDIHIEFHNQIEDGQQARKAVTDAIEDMESPDIDILSVKGPNTAQGDTLTINTMQELVTYTQLAELRKLIELNCFASDLGYVGIEEIEIDGR